MNNEIEHFNKIKQWYSTFAAKLELACGNYMTANQYFPNKWNYICTTD